MILEELQHRNYAQNTARTYTKIVARFDKYFGRFPEKFGPDQIREYRVYLWKDYHLAPGTAQRPLPQISATAREAPTAMCRSAKNCSKHCASTGGG